VNWRVVEPGREIFVEPELRYCLWSAVLTWREWSSVLVFCWDADLRRFAAAGTIGCDELRVLIKDDLLETFTSPREFPGIVRS